MKKYIKVIYALGSTNEVRRLNRCGTFAVLSLFRLAQSNRTAGRPKYKSVEPNCFIRRTFHMSNLIIRLCTCKVRRLNWAVLYIENTSWKVLCTVFTHELLTYQKSKEWAQRTSKISDTKTTSGGVHHPLLPRWGYDFACTSKDYNLLLIECD